MSLLTLDHIEEFKDTGVCVVENIFNDVQVDDIRDQFHRHLLLDGIDHNKILNGDVLPPSNIRLKSPSANYYYGKWKIDAQINPIIYGTFKSLMLETFSSGRTPSFEHPFGSSQDVVPFIDRTCYRLPDNIKKEGGLGLHLDRNPFNPYLFNISNTNNINNTNVNISSLKKWRPIQGFLTLTDHYGSDYGGLRVVKGFHKYIDEYFKDNWNKTDDDKKDGEFFRMIDKSYTPLLSKLEPVICPRGSLVLWDNRLPHDTSDILATNDSREVIYMSYLPSVDINLQYCQKQSQAIRSNILPPTCTNQNHKCDRDWEYDQLTPFQEQFFTHF